MLSDGTFRMPCAISLCVLGCGVHTGAARCRSGRQALTTSQRGERGIQLAKGGRPPRGVWCWVFMQISRSELRREYFRGVPAAFPPTGAGWVVPGRRPGSIQTWETRNHFQRCPFHLWSSREHQASTKLTLTLKTLEKKKWFYPVHSSQGGFPGWPCCWWKGLRVQVDLFWLQAVALWHYINHCVGSLSPRAVVGLSEPFCRGVPRLSWQAVLPTSSRVWGR